MSNVPTRWEEVFERVEETIKLAILNGTGAIRLFVDVNEAAGTRALEAVLQVKQKYWDAIQTQVAAFPQDGVYNGRGTEELMHRAMEMGRGPGRRNTLDRTQRTSPERAC